jgi:hypothetical protein
MSTKTKTNKVKSSKSTASKKKPVKSVSKKTKAKAKSKKTTKAPKPVLPPQCGCYSNDDCDFHDDADYLNPENAFSNDKQDDVEIDIKYYYAVNHTTKIKALITGEELPYEYAVVIAERVTEETNSLDRDDIHVAEVGYALYWILKKVFKVKEYEL